MAEHDPDYVAWFHSTAPPPAIAMRRAISLYQWLQKKTDMEYAKATEQIKHTTQAEAWRVFRHHNGRSLVCVMRIQPGEPICDVPLCLTVEREHLARGQHLGHALVTALATLDVDETVGSIQEHDPLSWHSQCRISVPHWPPNGTDMPQPKRDPSPPARRPRPEEPDNAHHHDEPFTVTFDTLDWPTQRRVTLPHGSRKRTYSSCVLNISSNKRRRSHRTFQF